ncbi:helix-turn-helix domain-containing protein [Streptomyces sp. NPDC001604]|uniref:helix-turn-helix domain-containing protein n=1 Tax=Streptomyces sp. NPDC001604 TaxID=3364593 RepID=UPI0036A00FF3
MDALVLLAQGCSFRSVAAELEVSAGTVSRWAKEPVFVAGLARVKAAVASARVDADAALAVFEEVARSLEPPGHGGPVVVSIPAGASPRRARKLVAQGVARAVERGLQ